MAPFEPEPARKIADRVVSWASPSGPGPVEGGKITHKEEYYDSASWWHQMGVDQPSVPILMDLTAREG